MARRPKLAVWKFASCDGCQLSVLDCEDELLALAGEVDLAYFLEASSAPVAGPVRPLARRGLDHHAGGRRAHPASAAAVEARGHDRRLRDRGRHPGAAQLRRRRGLPRRRLRVARVRLDARDVDRDLRAHPRRLRAARLPDRQAPAARGHQRVPQRAPARDRLAQRLRRVQARGQRLRHGRPRHAVPRPGHARRLRRAVPLLPPRLLRLLRPDGDAAARGAQPLAREPRDGGGRPRARVPDVQRGGLPAAKPD